MAQIRLRHPKGSSTFEIDLNNASVRDLQQQIYAISAIPPSQQDLKYSYPPRQLVLAPELPMSGLGWKTGDQIIVTQKAGSGAVSSSSSPLPATTAARAPVKPPAVPAQVPARPAAPAQPARLESSGSEAPEYVTTDAGMLVHRVVPDDNACLFNSVALVFEQDITKAQAIRKIVADAIRNDPENWSEAMLGHPREKYIETILKPTSWGGAIELSILATHYATEIASVDVETGRIDRFTPASGPATSRCILIYSGIHYDAASLSPMVDAPPDFHQTMFSADGDEQSDPVLRAAKLLAGRLRAKRAYTNTATFDLRCEVCNKGLKGEKEAQAHAMQTGHTAFGEY
ncbi:hypothetical protein M0805_008671 [Coniferiporia weirii]|nr:hypothetical protein M0805_008671 [Coniferiporia weirii]